MITRFLRFFQFHTVQSPLFYGRVAAAGSGPIYVPYNGKRGFVMKRTGFFSAFFILSLTVLLFGFFAAGCPLESPDDAGGAGSGPLSPPSTPPSTPPAPALTADIGFNATEDDSSGINLMAKTAGGIGKANQTYWFSVDEDNTTASFTVTKTAAQTLALSGPAFDAGQVELATAGTIVDGSTAGETLEIITAEFDDMTRHFAGERVFTLTVSEEGKSPKAVTVHLATELGASPGSAVFTVAYVNGKEILTKANAVAVAGSIPSGALGDGAIGQPVDNLMDALAWVDQQTVGTEAAPTEYLVRVEKDEPIMQMILTGKGQAGWVKIRLRGAAEERRIYHRENDLSYYYTSDNGSTSRPSYSAGLLSIGGGRQAAGYSHITLQIEDKITLDGQNRTLHPESSTIKDMVSINRYCTFIMEAGSKITGFKALTNEAYVFTTNVNTNAFYMRGGEICNNTLIDKNQTLIRMACNSADNTAIVQFHKTGGVFYGNTTNILCQGFINSIYKLFLPDNDSTTQYHFTKNGDYKTEEFTKWNQ
jgi:hypothetical protein